MPWRKQKEPQRTAAPTAIAEKDSKIGEEVKAVAKEQNESKEKIMDAMEKVESRGKFKTLLFGTDYKNIGKLRSEIATTNLNTFQAFSIAGVS